MSSAPGVPRPGRVVLVYTLHRVWLFAVSVLVLSVVLRGFALVIAALAVSALLSFVILRRQREQVAELFAERRLANATRTRADAERMERAKAVHAAREQDGSR